MGWGELIRLITLRPLCSKGTEKSTHQNDSNGTVKIVAFCVCYSLLYTVQSFLKILRREYISFSSAKIKVFLKKSTIGPWLSVLEMGRAV